MKQLLIKRLLIKRLLWGLTLSVFILEANTITLTQEQEQDWQIKTKVAKSSNFLPLGEFMAEVVTPPQNLYSVTLAFEAQVKKLHVASYDSIEKGQLLAEVTGQDWIAIQQQFIEESIELNHYQQMLNRKNRLCREEIIPKKECITANADYKARKSKVNASKALLKGYGASNQMIQKLANEFKISQTIPIYAEVSGQLLELNVRLGKSTTASDILFVILKKGELWLETDILAQQSKHLKEGQNVQIQFNGETFESKLLLHAPTINPINQTQKVRFSVPKEARCLSGLRDNAILSMESKTLKVAKESVINHEGHNVVFIKNERGYEALKVKILGEVGNYYYLEDDAKLQMPMATTSLAILKALMEGDDE
ncbi:MAG: Unknown protein [uncultured Sulfurovum sp.]|uniref:Uncharacterized protein n=1 Tax=uncultured Sulfurovum sp. TaxID=269237 RepID=A0A6S6SLL6_9BACT|nr:MAG: Unknown protein [uncultured Sulfurovum sp.]